MLWTGVAIGVIVVALATCLKAVRKRMIARKQLKKDNFVVAQQFRKDARILLVIGLVFLAAGVVLFVLTGGLVLFGF